MNTNTPLYNITGSSVVLFKNKKRFVAHASHINFRRIVDKIKSKDLNGIEKLFEIKNTVEKCFDVEILDNKEVRYKGVRVNSGVAEQVLNFVRNGIPHKPLVKFLDKLMKNPDVAARDSLYSYVNAHFLPITEDGDFIACKAVSRDWMDLYSGKVSNKVGEEVSMKREDVDNNNRECSGRGLHVGSDKYIKTYPGMKGLSNEDCRYIMVKVKPYDVVVVPSESGFGKIRICRYKVIREVSLNELEFTSHYAPENKTYKEIREIKKNGPKRNALGQFCKE